MRETKKVDRKAFLAFLEKWTSSPTTLDRRLITTFSIRTGDQLYQNRSVLLEDSSTVRHFRECQQID